MNVLGHGEVQPRKLQNKKYTKNIPLIYTKIFKYTQDIYKIPSGGGAAVPGPAPRRRLVLVVAASSALCGLGAFLVG